MDKNFVSDDLSSVKIFVSDNLSLTRKATGTSLAKICMSDDLSLTRKVDGIFVSDDLS
jgi:hypothetical protein